MIEATFLNVRVDSLPYQASEDTTVFRHKTIIITLLASVSAAGAFIRPQAGY